jgi:hypothetical protein
MGLGMAAGDNIELVLVLIVFGLLTAGIVGLCLSYGRDD